jgi:hypothetical protein
MDDILDDVIAAKMVAEVSKSGMAITLAMMPATLLAHIVHTSAHIHELMELIISRSGNYSRNIQILTTLLSYYLCELFASQQANPEVVNKLNIISNHPQIEKLLPHLHQLMPAKDQQIEYPEYVKKEFQETNTQRMLLLALLALANHSVRTYVVDKGYVYQN